MLQVVSTGAYYPPLDTAERVLLPQHPTLQRGHCAFCQDFRWLVGFVVPPQYLTIPLFWWPLSSQSTQWHGGATRTMEERDQSVKEKGTPLRGGGFLPSPLDSALTFSGQFSKKVKVESACFVIYCDFSVSRKSDTM